MISNPFLHAIVVFGLAISLAVLAGGVLYQILTGAKPDGNLVAAMISLLTLLEGYVRIDQAARTLKSNGNS